MKTLSKYSVLAIILAITFMFANDTAFAADKKATKAELEAKLEKLFQQTYEDPGNVDLSLEYAETAIKLKDYEAAIPPLERVLMYNPELADIRAQIGILYCDLGAQNTGKTYLEKALKGDISKDMKKRAKTYLKKIK